MFASAEFVDGHDSILPIISYAAGHADAFSRTDSVRHYWLSSPPPTPTRGRESRRHVLFEMSSAAPPRVLNFIRSLQRGTVKNCPLLYSVCMARSTSKTNGKVNSTARSGRTFTDTQLLPNRRPG
jgi:hypothetical protein